MVSKVQIHGEFAIFGDVFKILIKSKNSFKSIFKDLSKLGVWL